MAMWLTRPETRCRIVCAPALITVIARHSLTPRTRFLKMRSPRSLALLCVLLVSCTGTGADTPASNDTGSPILQRSWSVGGSADTALGFTSLSVHDVALDAQHRVLLIDRDNHRILVLSADGVLLGTWGRAGEGPGELQFPLVLATAPDSTTHVYDSGRRKIIVYGADGALRDEQIVQPRRPFRFRFLPDRSVVGSNHNYADSSRLWRDSSGVRTPLTALVRPATRSTPPVCRTSDYPVEPIFSPTLAWDARDALVASSTGDFAITVYEGGAAPRVLRRDTVRRRTSRELAARMLGDGPTIQMQGMKPCTVPAEQALADLFDGQTGFVETVPLGSARPVAFLHDGRMVSIERDRDDVPMLVVYTIAR